MRDIQLLVAATVVVLMSGILVGFQSLSAALRASLYHFSDIFQTI